MRHALRFSPDQARILVVSLEERLKLVESHRETIEAVKTRDLLSFVREATECPHNDWEMRGECELGFVFCNDCGFDRVPIVAAFNRLKDRMREAMDK